MKKVFALILAVILFLTAFAGCESSSKYDSLPEIISFFVFAESIGTRYDSSIFMVLKNNGIRTEVGREDGYECYYFPSDFSDCKIGGLNTPPERIEVQWEDDLIESIEIFYDSKDEGIVNWMQTYSTGDSPKLKLEVDDRSNWKYYTYKNIARKKVIIIGCNEDINFYSSKAF